jgi:signal peptidase II
MTSETVLPEHGRRWTGHTLLTVVVAALVVVIDQLTKRWALNHLADHNVHVIWTLQFNLTFNSGMAFSQGRGFGPIISVLAVAVVVILLASLRRTGSTLAAVALGMVIGGALGNVVDRVFRGDGFLTGEVIDFIDFQWWPVFNVADMGVVIGGILLVLTSMGAHHSPAKGRPNGSPGALKAGQAKGTP